MKRVFIVFKFFSAYWAEIRKCAALTAELWTALLGFGRELAEELRREEAGPAFDEAFGEEAGDDQSR